ncbi:hypothetical protein C8R45DRAFT_1073482 [Mycena sanguinolenta]|nr:hypothetical protein C8R45DRAFT_1073482 [Mycena sanguinolenta]
MGLAGIQLSLISHVFVFLRCSLVCACHLLSATTGIFPYAPPFPFPSVVPRVQPSPRVSIWKHDPGAGFCTSEAYSRSGQKISVISGGWVLGYLEDLASIIVKLSEEREHDPSGAIPIHTLSSFHSGLGDLADGWPFCPPRRGFTMLLGQKGLHYPLDLWATILGILATPGWAFCGYFPPFLIFWGVEALLLIIWSVGLVGEWSRQVQSELCARVGRAFGKEDADGACRTPGGQILMASGSTWPEWGQKAPHELGGAVCAPHHGRGVNGRHIGSSFDSGLRRSRGSLIVLTRGPLGSKSWDAVNPSDGVQKLGGNPRNPSDPESREVRVWFSAHYAAFSSEITIQLTR